MLAHPTLLLGSAQSNPDNVRLRAFDGLNDFAILLRGQRSKRRAVCSRHYNAGESGDKSRSEVLSNTRRATIRKVAIILCRGFHAECGHQFGSIDAASQVETMPTPDPHERHPVWNDHSRGVQNRLESRF